MHGKPPSDRLPLSGVMIRPMKSTPKERAKIECERRDLLLVEKKLYEAGEFSELIGRFKREAGRSATIDGLFFLVEFGIFVAIYFAFSLDDSVGPTLFLLQLAVIAFLLPSWIVSLRDFRRCQEILMDLESEG